MPLLFLLFLTSEISAQSIEQQLTAGLDLMYNFKMQQAGEVFSVIARKFPKDPRGMHYRSLVYLWEYLGGVEQKNFKKFLALSDSTIELAEEQIEKNDKNAIAYNALGMAHAARTIAFGKNDDYMSMVWAGKKSYSALQKSLSLDPALADNHLGIGLFKFGMSQVPATFSYLLKLIGYDGTVTDAVSHLTKAASDGKFTRIEAQYYLSFILSDYLNEPAKAEKYLEQLRKTYPQNMLFAYSYGVCLIKLKKLERAESIFNEILSNRSGMFSEITALSKFLQGDIQFRKNNFRNAFRFYSEFIGSAKNKDYTGIAYWRAYVSLMQTGNEAELTQFKKKFVTGNSSVEDDVYGARKSEEAVRNGITREEIVLTRFLNLVEAGNYTEGIDSLSQLLNYTSGSETKGRIYLGLAEAFFETGNYDQAINNARKAVETEIKYEAYVKPFACYLSAKAYLKKNNRKAMEEKISQAESYSGYDYSHKLKGLLTSLKNM